MDRSLIPLLAAPLLLASSGCDTKEMFGGEAPPVIIRPGGEKAQEPPKLKGPGSRHWTIFVDVVGGNLRLAQRKAEENPGRIPFTPSVEGAGKVIYKDKDRKVLGSYAILDPTKALDGRLGRQEHGGEPPAIPGFRVLLPPLRDIEYVEVVLPGKDSAELDVRQLLAPLK